jgi:16S rRNA (guanine966-N2)-methyltransferase
MRIIAGEFRGRVILPPGSDQTRPITDRVKQSLFDILTPDLTDAVVFDLFAGTGSLGLESLSRGARHATFFESDRSAHSLLKKNIATLNLRPRSTVISGDLFAWFAGAISAAQPADIVFLDPPYRFLSERSNELQSLGKQIAGHLSPNGHIIFRHDIRDGLEFPSLAQFDLRDYGSMRIEFLRARV